MTEEKNGSPGLGFVNIDFLIAKKGGPTTVKQDQGCPKGRNPKRKRS